MELHVAMLPLLTLCTFSHMRLVSSVSEITQNQFTQFTVFKCRSDVICAISRPNKTLSTNTAVECTFECLHLIGQRAVCEGVNYRQSGKQCDLFFVSPTSYMNNISGCEYIQVQVAAYTGS
jgi:hypothetical protein